MKVDLTKADSAKYQELWDEINTFAGAIFEGTEDNLIHTIYDYFANITVIQNLNNGRFLRVPCDEPIVEIDSDTRAININQFNGIQVVGDQHAELIFFSIDRYFDNQDLANCDIEILWKNAKGDLRKSLAAVQYTKDGKLFFAWQINNIITASAGNVQFAIRFLRENGNYEFNTLPAVLKIKANHGFDLSGDIQVVENNLNIYENSEFVIGDGVAPELVWLVKPDSVIELETTIVDGVPTSQAQDVYFLADAEPGTTIIYTDGEDSPLSANLAEVEVDIKKNNVILSWPYFDANEEVIPPENEEDNTAEVTANFVKLNIAEGGSYKVAARARLIQDDKVLAQSRISSVDVDVPAPLALAGLNVQPLNAEGDALIAAKGIVTNNADYENYSFDWSDSSYDNVWYVADGGSVTAIAAPVFDEAERTHGAVGIAAGEDAIKWSLENEIAFDSLAVGNYEFKAKAFKNGKFSNEGFDAKAAKTIRIQSVSSVLEPFEIELKNKAGEVFSGNTYAYGDASQVLTFAPAVVDEAATYQYELDGKKLAPTANKSVTISRAEEIGTKHPDITFKIIASKDNVQYTATRVLTWGI